MRYEISINASKLFSITYVNQLKVCKYVMEREGLEKTCLIFGKKVLEDNKFNEYMQKLRDALGRIQAGSKHLTASKNTNQRVNTSGE